MAPRVADGATRNRRPKRSRWRRTPRITSATIDRDRGDHRQDATGRPRSQGDSSRGPWRAQQVGDEVDRAGGQHDAVRARGRPRARRARRAARTRLRAGGPPELARTATAASRASSARGFALRGADDLARTAAAARGASRRRPCRRAPRHRRRARRPAAKLVQRLGQRLHAAGVVRAVEDGQRARRTRRRRSRSGRGRASTRRRPRTATSSSGRRGSASAAARASAKLRRWKPPRGDELDAGVGGRLDERRAALGADALGDRARVGVQAGADDERRAGRARRRASPRRCRRTVGPSQRVCSRPTFVSTWTATGCTLVAS